MGIYTANLSADTLAAIDGRQIVAESVGSHDLDI